MATSDAARRVRLDTRDGGSIHVDLSEVALVGVLVKPSEEVYVNFKSGDSWIVLKSDSNLLKLSSVMSLDETTYPKKSDLCQHDWTPLRDSHQLSCWKCGQIATGTPA